MSTGARLYLTAQIRQLEQIAVEQFGIQEEELMARAGLGAFTTLKRLWPHAKSVSVICGTGNNGGDGYVIARLAHQHGLNVKIYYLGDRNQLQGPAAMAHQACLAAAVPIESLTTLLGQDSNLEQLVTCLNQSDLLVDAMLGIGLQGEVRAEVASVIEALNATTKPVLAIDTPSGLDVDTGCVLGCAVQATATVTFIGMKPGLLTGSGPDYCGQVECHDLQIPSQAYSEINTPLRCLDFAELRRALKPRLPSSHKGHYGHVVVLGGDYGYPGAVRLSAEAALRVGAGLVTVITQPEHLPLISANRPEIMCLSANENTRVKKVLARATVIVIGPGLGQSSWSKKLWKKTCPQPKPKVIDADALNYLACQPNAMENSVLTPHPGEAARLLNTNATAVQNDRISACRQIQQRYGSVCVLKGAGTLIHDENNHTVVCRGGNPGMATGGMGDVLSGVIAGLIAQGLSLSEAAQLGVALHAHAGDAAAEATGQRGLLASDLMSHLYRLVNA